VAATRKVTLWWPRATTKMAPKAVAGGAAAHMGILRSAAMRLFVGMAK